MNRNTAIMIGAIFVGLLIIFGVLAANRNQTSDQTQNSSSLTQQDLGKTVIMENLSFIPASVEIKTGGEVTFANDDSDSHTITADDQTFDSGNLSPGESFKIKFEQTGTYRYHCELHPKMRGTISVK